MSTHAAKVATQSQTGQHTRVHTWLHMQGLHTHRTRFLSPPTAHPVLLQNHFLFIQGGSTCQRQGRETTSDILSPGLPPPELSAAAALDQAGLRDIFLGSLLPCVSSGSVPACSWVKCPPGLLSLCALRNRKNEDAQ